LLDFSNLKFEVFVFINNFCTFYRFGGKEEYMGFMNGFVEKEFVNMRRFIDDISVSCNVEMQ